VADKFVGGPRPSFIKGNKTTDAKAQGRLETCKRRSHAKGSEETIFCRSGQKKSCQTYKWAWGGYAWTSPSKPGRWDPDIRRDLGQKSGEA